MPTVLDFETKSDVDLVARGRRHYLASPEADILCMGYLDTETKVRGVWTPGKPLPDIDYNRIIAFNAAFERDVINTIGVAYGMPSVVSDNFIDVQALAGRYGLPQNLADLAIVLNLNSQKDPAGKHLIQLFCVPPYGRDELGNLMPHLKPQFEQLKKYCLGDVDTTYEAWTTLPASDLSPKERKYWLLNWEMNDIGLPIAYEEAKRIREVVEIYCYDHNERLPALTNGQVTKVTQVKRIVTWVNSQGVTLPNLQAETVGKILTEYEELPDTVAEVLELRAAIGLSSIGKYKRIENMTFEGRMHDNSRYYGAHTGRNTGMGFQLLNLPRKKTKTPEEDIRKFLDGSIVEENPVIAARALIRSMIKATIGHLIMVADYKSIEYVLLIWLAEDWEALDRFVKGLDQYIDMAAFLYGKAYDLVTDVERQFGKIIILGCGYGLGAYGFVRNAESWGVKIPLSIAKFAVDGYRSKFHKVVRMWYQLKDAALYAIRYKGKAISCYKCTFKVVKDRVGTEWLQLTLPSGRAMYYNKPFIDQDTYGDVPAFWGQFKASKTWIVKHLIPGLLTENIIQAIARDILWYGKTVLKDNGYKLIGSIYDEAISEVPEAWGTDEKLHEYYKLMCTREEWSSTIPLDADGFYGPRYKKN